MASDLDLYCLPRAVHPILRVITLKDKCQTGAFVPDKEETFSDSLSSWIPQ